VDVLVRSRFRFFNSGRSAGAGGGAFFAKQLFFDFFPLFLLCAQAPQPGKPGSWHFPPFLPDLFLKEAPAATGWATVVVVRARVAVTGGERGREGGGGGGL
jgi:hypothetical protein